MHKYDKLAPPRGVGLELDAAENAQLCQVHQPLEMTEVLKCIATGMRAHSYPPQDVFAVVLTVHEAASNAFRHGNRGDCRKAVRIRYLVTADEVLVRVEDEGLGFDLELVPDFCRPDNLSRPGCCGLLLMRAYSHWVAFDPPGNRVTFARRRSNP
jgi:serine/threonine-protein kinase RsbW